MDLAVRLLGVTADLHETRGTKAFNVKRPRLERNSTTANLPLAGGSLSRRRRSRR
jgi:hypothetical protein